MCWISFYKSEGQSFLCLCCLVHFSNNDSNKKSSVKLFSCRHTDLKANFLFVAVHLLKVNSVSDGSQSADVFAGNHKDVIALSMPKITKS